VSSKRQLSMSEIKHESHNAHGSALQ